MKVSVRNLALTGLPHQLFSPPPPPPIDNLSAQLIAFYKFDGNVNDSGPLGRNGTPSSPTYDVGKYDQCLSTGSMSRNPLGGLMNGGPLTITGFFYPTFYPADSAEGGSIRFGASQGITWMQYNQNDFGPHIMFGDVNASAFDWYITDTDWVFFALRHHGNGDIDAIINGAIINSGKWTGMPNFTATTFTIAASGPTFNIPFDNVGIWGYDLSLDDLSRLMAGWMP